ncbi:Protein of unknown function [Salinihabitans flavidus]|uniref:Surface lipoprotein assembly modifier C-terminal domain-containing protein n=1 Tax=Salinihabitans flavidus TaxID=569882 RepID=A0A1H8MGW9_9RHOB|nr:surface lipoprotein assembly modifier [Salinihabitans flavidus]SEO16577.1 Protein of unknown function [Salinihabitans flavidus]
MKRIVHRIRPFAAAAGLALLTAAPTAAEGPVTLSVAEMRHAAALSIAYHEPQQALELSQALLARDPGDIQALVMKSRAARDLGQYRVAQQAARRAWRLAEADHPRYGAALAMAQALASDGKRTRAQWWLRRASEHAPSPGLRARAIRDFRYVRQRNPWSAQLSFSIAPSSNVNSGSTANSVTLNDWIEFPITGAAAALSGTQISAGLRARYRLSESKTARNEALFNLQHQTYVLSDSAKASAPDVSGSDFAYSSVSVGLSRTARLPGTKAPYEITAELGRNWYGGDPYMNFVKLGAAKHFALSRRTRAHVGLSAEHQDLMRGTPDADLAGLRVGLDHRLGNGDRLSLGLSARQSTSTSPHLDYRRLTARAEYAIAKPVMDMQLSMGLSLSEKNHDRSRFTSDGRHDTEMSAHLTAVFPKLDYYGFVPSVTLHASRTDSNVGLYEKKAFGLHMGFRSAF